MNILIVDDNKNNIMILKLLLEDFVEDNAGIVLSLDEATDGLQAVEMCENKRYDIVLMDIMMPNMDGIEATKIIRSQNEKIMIIAVSAVDDSERKKLILRNGAEDYISKPVNSDIFMSRMANYITLIESRSHKKSTSVDSINNFTSEIFSRHIKFIINSEDSLSELWEYYLLNAEKKYDNLSDVIRTIFTLAETQLKLSIESEIYVECTEDFEYFTLTKIDGLLPKLIELILLKNTVEVESKILNGKISFKLAKIISMPDTENELIEDKKNKNVNIQQNKIEKNIEQEEIASPIKLDISSQALEVFEYLEEEDLLELQESVGSLNSLMLLVGSGDITEDEVIEIYTNIDRLASILSTYSEVYIISQSLAGLSYDMSTHILDFTKNSEALGPMCKAFSNDMSKWVEMSFETGAPSVDFMNETIRVNCQTIGSMLKMDEAPADGAEDFDDIFDF